MSLRSHADLESYFVILVFKPVVLSLFSWLLGDELASVSLIPDEDIELTILRISGMTLSGIA